MLHIRGLNCKQLVKGLFDLSIYILLCNSNTELPVLHCGLAYAISEKRY